MSKLFARRLADVFALAAGMALVVGAYAAEGHGRVVDEAPAKQGAAEKSSEPEPDIRPNLKAAAKRVERKEAADEHAPAAGKGGGKDKDKDLAAAEAKGSVSMAELRDIIDQKIAEVRAKQTAPAVVKVQSRAPKPKREGGVMPAMYTPGHEGSIPTPASAGKVSSGGGASRSAAEPAGHGAAAAVNAQGHDVHWAYSGDTGPESWGMLKPEFQQCMLGKRQSPIDIREGLPVQLDPIQFDYHPSGFKVIDNGHTIQANVEPGNSITVQGKRYELVQFHFHRPSEERVNGKQFEMVVHMVHKDADGKLAVVAVLIDQGAAPNPMIQLVWNSLPLEKGMEQASSVPIDLNLVLPEKKQYFTYMGSLTTPPCSEGVLWMVMKQPTQMTREQIGIFARMYQMNARPVQSAQGRMIKDGQ